MLEVRPATAEDARAVARIHVHSWRAAYGNGLLPRRYLDDLASPRLVSRWARRLREAEPNDDVWLAVEGGREIGFVQLGACYDDDSLVGFAGEIRMLYVAPSDIGRGIGGCLLEHGADELAARGYFWLVIWVLEGNERARAFYERNGLQTDGARRLDNFVGRDVPVVRYAKPLNPVIDYGLFPGVVAPPTR